MPLESSKDRFILKHPNGASAEILLYGATIISWRSSGEQNPSREIKERLFVSSKAVSDGTKAVRGGIPVVFPCFGPPTHPEHEKLTQHGFARTEHWKWAGLLKDNEAGVCVRLTLEPSDRIRNIYSKPFQLTYTVTLAEHQISTDLQVTNSSQSCNPQNLEFQALLHNYIRASAEHVEVTPLQNVTYYDKTQRTTEARSIGRVEQRVVVDVRNQTDSVYENASENYEIVSPEGKISLRSKNLKDVVVWNPGENGQIISDMEDGGRKHFICVEPGFVKGFIKLESGKTWVGQQVLTALL